MPHKYLNKKERVKVMHLAISYFDYCMIIKHIKNYIFFNFKKESTDFHKLEVITMNITSSYFGSLAVGVKCNSTKGTREPLTHLKFPLTPKPDDSLAHMKTEL